MDVVGRARRGQPADKPVSRSVRHGDREDQHREMLARRKEFDGDNNKFLVEYQQDIDIGNESELPKLDPGGFNQELKDPRRVLRRESLRTWLQIQVCLRESPQGAVRVWIQVCFQVCLHRDLVNQLRVDSRVCHRMRVALDKSNASANNAVHTPNSCKGCCQGETV